jgi:hypothetical protein
MFFAIIKLSGAMRRNPSADDRKKAKTIFKESDWITSAA